jgi:hypothetical protein
VRAVAAFLIDWFVVGIGWWLCSVATALITYPLLPAPWDFAITVTVGSAGMLALLWWLATGRSRPASLGRRVLQ